MRRTTGVIVSSWEDMHFTPFLQSISVICVRYDRGSRSSLCPVNDGIAVPSRSSPRRRFVRRIGLRHLPLLFSHPCSGALGDYPHYLTNHNESTEIVRNCFLMLPKHKGDL